MKRYGLHSASIGIILMSFGALLVPIVDGTAKFLTEHASPYFIVWTRFAISAAIILPISLAKHGLHALPRTKLGPQILRTVALVSAMTLYFVSLQFIPLATAVTAYFSGPIVALIFAVLFLSEKLTMTKGVSIALGALGTIVVLRPGTGTEIGIVLAFGSGILYAIYLLATRLSASSSSALQTLSFQCVVGAILLLPQALMTFGSMPYWTVPLFLLIGGISVLAHFFTISSFRYAEASTLAPLVYLELVGAVLFGLAVFSEIPDRYTIVGGSLIVLSGLILWFFTPRSDDTQKTMPQGTGN